MVSMVREHEITLWWNYSTTRWSTTPPKPKPFAFHLIAVHTLCYDNKLPVRRVRVDCIDPLSGWPPVLPRRKKRSGVCDSIHQALQQLLDEEHGRDEWKVVRNEIITIQSHVLGD